MIVLLLSDSWSWFGGVFPHVVLFFFLVCKRPRQTDEGLKSTLVFFVCVFSFFLTYNDNDSPSFTPVMRKPLVLKKKKKTSDNDDDDDDRTSVGREV